jgi:CTP synthase (UTP-ammonia lyase)
VAEVRIAIVGDYEPGHETHPATGEALTHSAARLGVDLTSRWVPTLELEGRAGELLADADGVWIAPGSPYASLEGALEAITFARTTRRPLLGTCAGFQHVVLETGRSVLGLADAAHAEYEPGARDDADLMIDALTCSLVGQTMQVRLQADSLAARAYGRTDTTERYYCNFGLNPRFAAPLAAGGLPITGTDQDGEARVVERPDHPFFVATLFVPQTSSAPDAPHPLVTAFVRAAASAAPAESTPASAQTSST